MQPDIIIVSEYCRKINLDPSFLYELEESGLISISIEDGEKYFESSQLPVLEKYIRMHYDLSINVEGIDVIQNMQNRMTELEERIIHLRNRLRIYESDFFDELE